MPIRTMHQYVSLIKAGDHTLKERLGLLAAHREEVAGKIEELQGHLEVLDRKLERGCSPDHETEATPKTDTNPTTGPRPGAQLRR